MANPSERYDVAVIGGGPAGSQVAYRLAAAGHQVIVLERKENLTGPVCCTGIVSKLCVDSFSIPENLVRRWANSAIIYSPSGKAVRVWREAPQAAILDRPAFNLAWASRAAAAGAKYLYGADVRSLRPAEKNVTIEAIHDRQRLVLQARAVVIAAGFGSHLVDTAGLGAAADFVMGAQVEVNSSLDEVEVYLGAKIAPGFFGWLAPTARGQALVGLLSHRHPPAYLRSLITHLTAVSAVTAATPRFTYGGVTLGTLRKTYGARVLAVGTAAGQVKPATGGGIHFGLVCADIAAGVLDRALAEDNLSAERLAAYERNWKRRLGREIRLGRLARLVLEHLTDPQVDRILAGAESQGLIDELRDAPELSFDSHADVIARLLSQRLFKNVVRSLKPPLGLKKSAGTSARGRT